MKLPQNRAQKRVATVNLRKTINYIKAKKAQFENDANNGDNAAEAALELLATIQKLESNEDKLLCYYQFKQNFRQLKGRPDPKLIME